ncbi:MAG: hypothetical protein HOP30_09015 [Cyclobacteriaceae bacterium]|nr:hypothetical protein [Cyclobacteriaceae bacterium]
MENQKAIKAFTLLAVLLGSLLFSFAYNAQKVNPDRDQQNCSISEIPDDDRISFIRNSEEEVNSTKVNLDHNHLSEGNWHFQIQNDKKSASHINRTNPSNTRKLYLRLERLLI